MPPKALGGITFSQWTPNPSKERTEGGWRTETRPKSLCKFCKGRHWSSDCQIYPTLDGRSKRLGKNCRKCLNSSHRTKQCQKQKACFFCRSPKHHCSLCPKQSRKNPSVVNGAQPATEKVTKPQVQQKDQELPSQPCDSKTAEKTEADSSKPKPKKWLKPKFCLYHKRCYHSTKACRKINQSRRQKLVNDSKVNEAQATEMSSDSSAVGKNEPLPNGNENPGSSETPGDSSPLAHLKVHVDKSLQPWEEQAETEQAETDQAYVPWQEQAYNYLRSQAAQPQ